MFIILSSFLNTGVDDMIDLFVDKYGLKLLNRQIQVNGVTY